MHRPINDGDALGFGGVQLGPKTLKEALVAGMKDAVKERVHSRSPTQNLVRRLSVLKRHFVRKSFAGSEQTPLYSDKGSQGEEQGAERK